MSSSPEMTAERLQDRARRRTHAGQDVVEDLAGIHRQHAVVADVSRERRLRFFRRRRVAGKRLVDSAAGSGRRRSPPACRRSRSAPASISEAAAPVVGFMRFSTMCRQKPTTLAIERRQILDGRHALPHPSGAGRRVRLGDRRDGQAVAIELERSRELLPPIICGLTRAFGSIGDRLLRGVHAVAAPEAAVSGERGLRLGDRHLPTVVR